MRFATRRRAILLSFLGLLLAIFGVVGYWIKTGVSPTDLTDSECELIRCEPEDNFRASFLIAGRDIKYTQIARGPQYNRQGRVVSWDEPAQGNSYGTNTDTILFVQLIGKRVYLIAIPRDIYLNKWQTKINSMYHYQGVEGLLREVSDIIGLPIDYYAIVNIDVFKRVVDALGGVDINVPYDMHYVDNAAQLFIDLESGEQHLNGEEAANFVRFRETAIGDYGRIDNLKLLASALLVRAKQLNVRVVEAIPEIINTYVDEVETNIPPQLILKLLPHLGKLELIARTLPTYTIEGTANEATSSRTVEEMLAETFGGTPRNFSEVPKANLLITNQSGEANLALWVKQRLIAMGIPQEHLFIRDGDPDPAPSRILVDNKHWQEALYYADVFHLDQHQVFSIDTPRNVPAGIELILGRDATNFYFIKAIVSRNMQVEVPSEIISTPVIVVPR